jgi:nucleoside-diphosphate-sugar epimerase
MKIVVIGGTGLIGSKTVAILRQGGHEARYWGGRVEERSLVPLGSARLGCVGLDEWLRRSRAGA